MNMRTPSTGRHPCSSSSFRDLARATLADPRRRAGSGSPLRLSRSQSINSAEWNILVDREFGRNLSHGQTAMNPSEELRRHAIECGQMANFLRDKNNSAEWNRIAERYLRCAQWYDTRRSLADHLKHVRAHKRPVSQSAADPRP